MFTKKYHTKGLSVSYVSQRDQRFIHDAGLMAPVREHLPWIVMNVGMCEILLSGERMRRQQLELDRLKLLSMKQTFHKSNTACVADSL
jgi:hypothetical protein